MDKKLGIRIYTSDRYFTPEFREIYAIYENSVGKNDLLSFFSWLSDNNMSLSEEYGFGIEIQFESEQHYLLFRIKNVV
jgi:hypothetical protein